MLATHVTYNREQCLYWLDSVFCRRENFVGSCCLSVRTADGAGRCGQRHGRLEDGLTGVDDVMTYAQWTQWG